MWLRFQWLRNSLSSVAASVEMYGSGSAVRTRMVVPEVPEGPADLRDRYIAGAGSAEFLAEQINTYKEAGAGGVIMALTSMTVDGCLRDIEVVATKVMPLVG